MENGTRLISSFNEFAIDLLRTIHASRLTLHENAVFSSYSSLIALLMLLAGTKHRTQSEIARGLRLDDDDDKFLLGDTTTLFHEHLASLIANISNSANQTSPHGNRLISVNRILINEGAHVQAEYVRLCESIYKAKVKEASEQDTFADIVKRVNALASELTNGKLADLLDESFASSSLTLLNVIYFNYEWMHAFDEAKTLASEPFYLDAARSNFAHVSMMRLDKQRLQYAHLKDLDAHLVALPYANNDFVFNVLVPTATSNDWLDSHSPSSIINRVDLARLLDEAIRHHFAPKDIILMMPKFTIRSKIELKPILERLGIKDMFDSRTADLTGIAQSRALYVEQIMHHAVIEVNEKGTEAAAATAIKIMKRSIPILPLEIRLDRPFVYIITERNSGLHIISGTFNGETSELPKKSEKQEL